MYGVCAFKIFLFIFSIEILYEWYALRYDIILKIFRIDELSKS